ncbi:MAG: hypothetical protein WA624_11005, partial [Methylocella sp.]
MLSAPFRGVAGHRSDRYPDLVLQDLNWHSPDNRECAKRVSLISCRDIGHSSYTGIIFRIARLLRL